MVQTSETNPDLMVGTNSANGLTDRAVQMILVEGREPLAVEAEFAGMVPAGRISAAVRQKIQRLGEASPVADWLARGLDQPGGKLPCFDEAGRWICGQVVDAAVAAGWAASWFCNPLHAERTVYRLTVEGRDAALSGAARNVLPCAHTCPRDCTAGA